MKRDDIFKEILKNPIYDSILVKYLPDEYTRDEFRQWLWVMLCEIKPERIEELWKENKFLYYYCAIVKTQLTSGKSKWYKKYRAFNKNSESFKLKQEIMFDEYGFEEEIDINDNFTDYGITNETEEQHQFEYENNLKQLKHKMINNAIQYHLQRNPHLKLDFDLFKMKYEQNMTLRDISAKLNIPLTDVFKYIRNATQLIKANIMYKQNNLR